MYRSVCVWLSNPTTGNPFVAVVCFVFFVLFCFVLFCFVLSPVVTGGHEMMPCVGSPLVLCGQSTKKDKERTDKRRKKDRAINSKKNKNQNRRRAEGGKQSKV